MIRKVTYLVLGEDQVTVHGDIKNTTGSSDQLRIDAVTVFQTGRQTGGAGFVVSNTAVLDADIHVGFL